jgi:hypothetical protein
MIIVKSRRRQTMQTHTHFFGVVCVTVVSSTEVELKAVSRFEILPSKSSVQSPHPEAGFSTPRGNKMDNSRILNFDSQKSLRQSSELLSTLHWLHFFFDTLPAMESTAPSSWGFDM